LSVAAPITEHGRYADLTTVSLVTNAAFGSIASFSQSASYFWSTLNFGHGRCTAPTDAMGQIRTIRASCLAG